jgi:translation initiation factor 1 (eIF-1/SUI1)
MIRLAMERKTITGLDDLTEDQRADIDRLLTILWKTCPGGCSVKKGIFEDRQYAGESEEALGFHFLQASGL